MGNRKEYSFRSLLESENEKKSIIIPIIQRDYAQGRDDEKAIKVRERLISDWIAVLSDPNKRMDFNFIYGEETNYGNETVFFPVDGQQRLTSLYLLHWYLAYETNNSNLINKWNFDYKTRNSASEFFAFFKSDEAGELYKLLSNEDSIEKIKDAKWFKMKWENDPTINACLSFLCTLANKLKECKKNDPDSIKKFWQRLEGDNTAIYFTYLQEKSNNAEIHAARTYTRMNARGKRLTDFENLKAMIDELESRQEDPKMKDYEISSSFDRIYIDYLYKGVESFCLSEATKKINEKSLNWFRLVYFVYYLKYKKRELTFQQVKDNYEDEIYRLSQGRMKDEHISNYLIMLKTVLETMCNSNGKIKGVIDIDSVIATKRNIAFILFTFYKWEKKSDLKEQIRHNEEIVDKWIEFEKMLSDLRYNNWICSEVDYVRILGNIMKNYQNPSDYFVSHDFDTDNPFNDWRILKDLKCRVIESKIMWHIISCGGISEQELREFRNKNYNNRIGYLYFICGYMQKEEDWNLGDWSQKPLPNNVGNIKSYIEGIKRILGENIDTNFTEYYQRAVYAYSTQYDKINGQIKAEEDINNCSKEHIWKSNYLYWDDEEYNKLLAEKIKQMEHFLVMLNLVTQFGQHSQSKQNSQDKCCEEYYKSIQNTLSVGYENCWLRFALQYGEIGNEILTHELENKNGTVHFKDKEYDVALYTYFLYKKYKSYNVGDKRLFIGNIQSTDNRWYYVGEGTRLDYKEYINTCVFQENTTYNHSKKVNVTYETVSKKVNMDLIYNNGLTMNFLQGQGKCYLTFEKNGKDEIEVRKYELCGKNNGKAQIKIDKVILDCNFISHMEGQINNWKSIIDDIVYYPASNSGIDAYDTWLDLRNGDKNVGVSIANSASQGGINNGSGANISSNINNITGYGFKGGTRKKCTWSDTYIDSQKCSYEIDEF